MYELKRGVFGAASSLVAAALAGVVCSGCADGSHQAFVPPPAAAATAAPVVSASPWVRIVTAPRRAPVFDPATTVTVVAGGFSSSGAGSTSGYGVDDSSSYVNKIAARLNVPVGDVQPTAPNQMTEVRYYGAIPPAYYSPSDVQEVDAQRPGTPRYALIVAKHIRHVLDRSGAQHVNLVGASFGGIISRYVLEKDLEGLASSGRIVRWLTIESTVSGVYMADMVTKSAVTIPILSLLAHQPIDPTDLRTMTTEFVKREFNTPDPKRSTTPLLAGIIVGHQVSSDSDTSGQVVTHLSGLPNDGLLLSRDQHLHVVDALPPRGPALVYLDTTHNNARHDEGFAASLANFLRSRRRVTVRVVSAQAKRVPEAWYAGDGELIFCAKVRSPEALREWGVTDEVGFVDDENGIAPMTPFAPGQTRAVDLLLFDWFVAPGEQRLELDLKVVETDFSWWYHVVEDPGSPTEVLDAVTVGVPVTTLGTTTIPVDTPSFSALLEVRVLDE